MHLLFLEPKLHAHLGGAQLSNVAICKALAALGVKIRILCFEKGELLSQYESFGEVHCVASPYRTFQKPLADTLRLRKVLGAHFFRGLTHAYSWNSHDLSFVPLAFLARSHGIPFFQHLRAPQRAPFAKRHLLAHRLVSAYFVPTQFGKTAWEKAGLSARKIHVVPNGISLSYFSPQAADPSLLASLKKQETGVKVISYVGRLDPDKDISTLIKAVREVKARENVHLILAGQSTDPKKQDLKKLEQEVQALGLKEMVTFLGYVSDPRAVYSVSDLVVLPSSGPEPFGRVIVESMASEVPVVASRIGGIPEVLGELNKRFLFPAGESQALAQVLLKHLHWRKEEPDLGKKLRAYAQRFSIDGSARQILKVLEELSKPPKRL